MLESDLAYVWIEPTMKHLYDFKLLLKQMSSGQETIAIGSTSRRLRGRLRGGQ
jgi:hypothetical protein